MNTTLTKEQSEFLKHHNIPLASIFDAQGLSRKNYFTLMKELNKQVAINVSPCKKFGHTMRNKHGTCLQCNPGALTFSARYHVNGSVYIAGSLKGKMVKVGFSLKPEDRESALNSDYYGGFNDWKLLYTVRCDNAGKLEFDTQTKLKQFNTPGTYRNYAQKPSQCYELFACTYSTAKKAIADSIQDFNSAIWEAEHYIHQYEFSANSSKTSQRNSKKKQNKQIPSSRKPHQATSTKTTLVKETDATSEAAQKKETKTQPTIKPKIIRPKMVKKTKNKRKKEHISTRESKPHSTSPQSGITSSTREVKRLSGAESLLNSLLKIDCNSYPQSGRTRLHCAIQTPTEVSSACSNSTKKEYKQEQAKNNEDKHREVKNQYFKDRQRDTQPHNSTFNIERIAWVVILMAIVCFHVIGYYF